MRRCRRGPHSMRASDQQATRRPSVPGGWITPMNRLRFNRFARPFATLLLAALPLGLWPSTAWAGPTCLGKPATHVMQPGEGIFNGGPGNDVVVGSEAGDKVHLDGGGIDVVCGNGGVDLL